MEMSNWGFIKEFGKPKRWRLLAHCFYVAFRWPAETARLAQQLQKKTRKDGER